MYMEQGFRNISIDNAPYFGGNYDFSPNASCGNMYLLQKKFNEAGMNNVSTCTNAKIAQVEGKYHLLSNDNPHKVNEYVMYHLPQYLSFKKSDTGSFLQFFSQQTHEDYVYRDEKGKMISTSNQECFFDAMYTAIKELQNVFIRLKEEPYYNEVGDKIGNVYDHTLIYMVSDHGFSLLKYLTNFYKILNYLSSCHLITQEQITSLLNFDSFAFNPTIMIKPFKYNQQEEVIHNQITFDFNVDQIVTLADLQRIVEIYLNEYNGTIDTTSRFVNPNLLNKIENKTIRDIVAGETLLYPLSSEFNSIQAKKFTNRQVYYCNPFS